MSRNAEPMVQSDDRMEKLQVALCHLWMGYGERSEIAWR